MRIGTSLFVITVGAILSFGVTRSPGWLDVHTVGGILIVVGVVGLVLGQMRRSRRRRSVIQGPIGTTYIETGEVAEGGRDNYDGSSVG